MSLNNPTANYCEQYSAILMDTINHSIKGFQKIYRECGFSDSEALDIAQKETQKLFNECDFTVNFDGPMAQ